MNRPKACLFDLDETLAESFKPPKPEMTAKVKKLLDFVPVGVITGRTFSWIEPDFLPHLVDSRNIDHLYIFPESSTQCFQWNGSAWNELYAFAIGEVERTRIRKAIEDSVEETGTLKDLPQFGSRFLDKTAMISFACLGYQVPSDMKYTWDPGNKRRKILQAAISQKLPDLEVALGGATTIDVTERGQNKTRGVVWLSEHLRIPPQEMFYVGDALYEGGNDQVVISTGIQTKQTSGPEETLSILDGLLASFEVN